MNTFSLDAVGFGTVGFGAVGFGTVWFGAVGFGTSPIQLAIKFNKI